MTQPTRPRFSGELVWGILLILAGALFFLDNIRLMHIEPLWRYWPLILVAIGFAKLFQVRALSGIGPGIWWIFLGLWLFVSIHGIYGLDFSNSWPLLVIAWGVSIMWQAMKPRRPAQSSQEHHHE